jgi:hypothetical protein
LSESCGGWAKGIASPPVSQRYELEGDEVIDPVP